MQTILLAFVIFILLIIGMAIGVIFGRKPIAGSCGGMAALKMDVACDICKGDPAVCETEQEKMAAQASTTPDEISYDATTTSKSQTTTKR